MIKNSEFTKIFFRFLKEYDKKSYYTTYKLFSTAKCTMGGNDETLYSLYQKNPSHEFTKVGTPRDIILVIYENSSNNDKHLMWDKYISYADMKWIDFCRKNKLCSKFFRHLTAKDKEKYSLKGNFCTYIEKEGTC